MKISYQKGESDGLPASKGDGASHLTVTAIAISVVVVVIGVGLWFGFSQSKKAIEAVPAAVIPPVVTKEMQQARVYEAIDGLNQCHKNIPDVSTAEARKKRQDCYYAVMTIFTTSAICNIITLDGASSELCKQAEARFLKDYPHGMPTDAQLQNQTNSTTTTGTKPGAGGNQNSTSGARNTNTGSNTNVNVNTNTAPGNTNTSANTNTNANTNSSVATGNTNSNSNTNQTASSTRPLCVINTGTVVLLEHTNDCQ